MPSPIYTKEVHLDEVINYFNNLYIEVNNTQHIDDYIFQLESFIDPRINSKKIDNLKSFEYSIVILKSNFSYALNLYTPIIAKPPTFLTNLQIEELQKFNNYLKQPDIIKIVSKSRFISISIFLIVIGFIILFTCISIFH